MDLRSCILWARLPQHWCRASSPLVSWHPSKQNPKRYKHYCISSCAAREIYAKLPDWGTTVCLLRVSLANRFKNRMVFSPTNLRGQQVRSGHCSPAGSQRFKITQLGQKKGMLASPRRHCECVCESFRASDLHPGWLQKGRPAPDWSSTGWRASDCSGWGSPSWNWCNADQVGTDQRRWN